MADIEHEYRDDVLVISFGKEELKLQDAERIIEIVFDLETSWSIQKIVLDMNGVTYTNSTVISAIGRLADAKDLRVVNLHAKVQAILDTMGLLPFLEFAPDVDAAIASFE
ncbi:MAG: hypothetical protein MUC63_09810 [Planctomycetes bacterium]|nr:hypothetical protein [Planctomycetota bacterium]